jgi:hypothetical protein
LVRGIEEVGHVQLTKKPRRFLCGALVLTLISLATKRPLRLFDRIGGCLDGNHSYEVHFVLSKTLCPHWALYLFMAMHAKAIIALTVLQVGGQVNRVGKRSVCLEDDR